MIWRVLTFTGFGLTAGVIGMWMSERTPPVDILDVQVVTPVVRPGADLRIKYSVYRRANCRSQFQRTYRDYDEVRYALEPVDIWMSPAPLGRDEYVSVVPISPKAAQGQAAFRAITVYVCNPIHNVWPIVQVAAEASFVIAGPPLAAPLPDPVQRR